LALEAPAAFGATWPFNPSVFAAQTFVRSFHTIPILSQSSGAKDAWLGAGVGNGGADDAAKEARLGAGVGNGGADDAATAASAGAEDTASASVGAGAAASTVCVMAEGAGVSSPPLCATGGVVRGAASTFGEASASVSSDFSSQTFTLPTLLALSQLIRVNGRLAVPTVSVAGGAFDAA
jgi:hypothetical protein